MEVRLKHGPELVPADVLIVVQVVTFECVDNLFLLRSFTQDGETAHQVNKVDHSISVTVKEFEDTLRHQILEQA